MDQLPRADKRLAGRRRPKYPRPRPPPGRRRASAWQQNRKHDIRSFARELESTVHGPHRTASPRGKCWKLAHKDYCT
ncbi:hypothetical protein U9M48_020961 [Paspalum notatum var. saurae]|uniref:Uncharacterized protein n=1 Tax=Paspalum notatum var. saurae TaxID=547442 RepID=A0AAQ3TIJ9_PASNO